MTAPRSRTPSVPDWIERLAHSAMRLRHLGPNLDAVMTSPDPATGERWTAAQVYAHIVELLDYWPAEVRRVIAGSTGDVEFGRTKADPARLAAVAAARGRSANRLSEEGLRQIAVTSGWLEQLTDDELASTGRHFKRGSMTTAEIIEVYVVGHVEEHVEQLVDALAQAGDGK